MKVVRRDANAFPRCRLGAETALLVTCAAALAQNEPVPRAAPVSVRLEPVVVTGPHIPRIDGETALPVEMITFALRATVTWR